MRDNRPLIGIPTPIEQQRQTLTNQLGMHWYLCGAAAEIARRRRAQPLPIAKLPDSLTNESVWRDSEPASLPARWTPMLDFSPPDSPTPFLRPHAVPDALAAGFRLGAIGTHTSRTLMFDELTSVLERVPPEGRRQDYQRAIVDDNALSKPTSATRRLSNQRMGELYALDPEVPLFRVFRRLWKRDPMGHRLLALLVACARDPLLTASASPVLALPPGADLPRDGLRATLRAAVRDRLNEDVLDKVVRNVASSWTQSGHLEGRIFKKRRMVKATPASLAFAFFLAWHTGHRGVDLFACGWVALLDCPPADARTLAFEAKRHGYLDLRIAGDVIEVGLSRLDPAGATLE